MPGAFAGSGRIIVLVFSDLLVLGIVNGVRVLRIIHRWVATVWIYCIVPVSFS